MESPLTLQGTIEVVTFTSTETMYSVLRVRPEDGQDLPDCLVGIADRIQVGI